MTIEFNWSCICDDDYSAQVGDFTLRAEKMGRRSWWWCVYHGNETIASAVNLSRTFKNGKKARRAAEEATLHMLALLEDRAFREKLRAEAKR